VAVEAIERLQLKVLKAAVPLLMSPANYRDRDEQFTMTVSVIRELSEHVRRITFRATPFATFATTGPDEYCGLIFPTAPGQPLTLPDPGRVNVRTAVARIPEADRPEIRWYTIRSIRPEIAEIDIDVIVHGDSGPGSAWALRAVVGDVVGFRAAGSAYRPQPVGARQLLVADETAMPALYAILETLPAEVGDVTAILELPDESYDTGSASSIRPQIVLRGSEPPGSAALELVRRSSVDGLRYVWVCGESALATGVRRHLVKERGIDRRAIMFSGYWKLGSSRN